MAVQRFKKTVWLNERTAGQGFIELDGKRIQTGNAFSHDATAERQILGCILAAGETGAGRQAMQRIGYLRYDDFFGWANGLIYRACERVYQNGDEIDFVTVKAELQASLKGGKTLLELVGGERYLLEVSNVVAVNIEAYANIVIRMAIRRSMKLTARVTADLADNNDLQLKDLLDKVHQMNMDITIRYQAITDQNTYTLYDRLDEHFKQVDSELDKEDFSPAIKSGIESLDNAITGWRPGLIYIFAAPPGWGKTALLLCIALYALQQGKRVLFISLEMPVDDMISRLVCILAGIDTERFDNRILNPDERQRMNDAYAKLRSYKASKQFIISYMKRPTMNEIEAQIQRHELSPGLDLVIGDYVTVTKIAVPHLEGNEFGQVSYIYGRIEHMKQDYPHLAFIWATQMNSKWDHRKGKRPGDTDLYYGSVGYQVADYVGYIYHPSRANANTKSDGTAEIITRKNRRGKSANVTSIVKWEPEYTRFSSAPPRRQYEQIDINALKHWSNDE